jgi:hypothetical protein
MNAFETVMTQAASLTADELKSLGNYCLNLSKEMQSEAIKNTKAELRALQDKIDALKGMKTNTKNTSPVFNPANSNETYTMGRRPLWLNDLMLATGKTVDELRMV